MKKIVEPSRCLSSVSGSPVSSYAFSPYAFPPYAFLCLVSATSLWLGGVSPAFGAETTETTDTPARPPVSSSTSAFRTKTPPMTETKALTEAKSGPKSHPQKNASQGESLLSCPTDPAQKPLVPLPWCGSVPPHYSERLAPAAYIAPGSSFSVFGSMPASDSLTPLQLGERYAFLLPNSSGLLGDAIPGRKWLRDHGVVVSVFDKTENVGNVSGGGKRVFDYAGEAALAVDVDWGALTNDSAASGILSHVVIVNRSGRDVMWDAYHEAFDALQETYGWGGNVVAHMVYAYTETRVLWNRMSVQFGWLPVGQTFGQSDVYCQFTTLCSAPRGLKNEDSFTIWPRATWGAAGTVRPFLDNFLSFGAFQANHHYGSGSGWAWFDKGNTGVMLPVEDVWQPYIGPHALVGHYKVGYAFDSSRYRPFGPKLFKHENSRQTAQHGVGRSRSDALPHRKIRQQRRHRVLRFVHNTASNSLYKQEFFGGIDGGGIVPGRPYDHPGIAFAWYDISPSLTRYTRVLHKAGVPTGVLPLMGTGTLEIKYAAAIIPGLVITPEYYLVIHPAESRRYGTPSVIGFTTSAAL